MSNINLEINNFGPINKANMELKKLNVIAGVNGSGKSTSSKLLYCFLASVSNEGNFLANKSLYDRIFPVIEKLHLEFDYDMDNLVKVNKVFNSIVDFTNKNFSSQLQDAISSLKKIINESQITDKKEYMEKLEDVENILEVNGAGYRKFFDVSSFLLDSEFNHYDVSNVHVNVNQTACEFSCELKSNNSKTGFIITEGDLDCLDVENIIYIDSASAFDIDFNRVSEFKNLPHHIKSLSRQLNSSKNDDVYDQEFNKKLDVMKMEFNEMMGGRIYYDNKNDEFKFKKDDKIYSMKNTASGIKQLGMLQVLLDNRLFSTNCFLIIDEPEVNLHPEWQLKFAEIIVFMIKELNISVFINSHSPQFIEALEVYSGKYGLVEESRFYLSKETESGKFDFREIKRKNLNILYDNLGNPYDKIDEIRIENVFNGIE